MEAARNGPDRSSSTSQARGLEAGEAAREQAQERPPALAITSGKGGVGKTAIVANLASLLSSQGLRVFLLDADYGLANLAVQLGLVPGRTIEDALEGRCTLAQTLVEPRPGLVLVPAASGARRLGAISPEATRSLLAAAGTLARGSDLILIDTAAGIAPSVLATLAWADEVIVVVGDDPSSFVDAYAMIKLVNADVPGKPLGVLVNRTRSRAEGEAIQRNLERVATRFLGRKPEAAGIVPQDAKLLTAVRAQRLVVVDQPQAPSSRALAALAERIVRSRRVLAPIAG